MQHLTLCELLSNYVKTLLGVTLYMVNAIMKWQHM